MKTSFLNSLQAMRFFAALGVVQYHLWQNYFGKAFGHPGTDFFLILVGMVSAYTLATQISTGNWWQYISGRYKRLYVTFVPLFVIILMAKWSEVNLSWALKSFFFIPIAGRSPVIGSTWMLSMFILFYFVFSVCFVVKTEKILWVVFLIWTILITAYNFYDWKPNLAFEWSNLFFNERNYCLIIGYLGGVVLRNDWLQIYQARIFLWIGLVGIAVGTILINSGPSPVRRVFILSFPVSLFVLGLAALEQKKVDDGIVRLLTSPRLAWLGGTSYVLYLSHGLFFQLWSRIFPVSLIWILPMTIGAIAMGAFGYMLWENPVLTYLKNGKWIVHRMPEIHFMQHKVHRSRTI